MYAITANSYRAITSAADVQPGETLSETVPQSLLDSISATATATATNRATLQQQVVQGLATIDAFLALPSPTNAQALAQVQFQARAIKRLARLVVGVLDSTS